MAYTLADLLAAEEAAWKAWREADGPDHDGNPRAMMRALQRARDEASAQHRPIVEAIRADLVARADPEYLTHVAAQEAERRDAHEKEEAAKAERTRIQDALHALYPAPKRGARYVFEGRVYVRRVSQFASGRPTYFKQVPRDPSKGDP
jgi:hypothetical protein